MKYVILLFSFIFITSCAQDIYVQYPGEGTHDQSIRLQPNRPTFRTFVTIDQQLVVDRQDVRSVTIENVPVGKHEIDYVCDNTIMQHPLDAEMTIWIEEGKSETHLIELPPNSAAYWIGEAINYFLLIGWIVFWVFIV